VKQLITSESEIPKAYAYVLADDRFMSNWGKSDGRTNVVIVPVDNADELAVVKQNIEDRGEMENIRTVLTKPPLYGGFTYSLLDRSNASKWYEEDRPFRAPGAP
jgi:hypothetical protein